ncbi:carbonate dehydratase [Pandoraea faecigallinarum]|uniref:carbonate dehydratase n=1 Tax=Pandoraea faecigallinarum TaxID=656179 RepID=UPI003AAAA30D
MASIGMDVAYITRPPCRGPAYERAVWNHIGSYAVLRADEVDEHGRMEPIVIGANSNIQDGVVIHSKDGARVSIGENTSIAHRSIVHGPGVVGDNAFVGFNSVLFNCVVHDGVVARHNSVVDGWDIPPTTHIRCEADLATIPKVTVDAREFSESVSRTNVQLARAYRRIQNEF